MTITTSLSSPATGWFKSSFSNPALNCVEVCFDHEWVHIRDTKDHGNGPTITLPVGRWSEFLTEAMDHVPDGGSHTVIIDSKLDGGTHLRTPGSEIILAYTASEWTAFVSGIRIGEFSRS